VAIRAHSYFIMPAVHPPFVLNPLVLFNKLVPLHIHSISISTKFGCKVIAESCVEDNHGPHGLSNI